MIDVSALNGDPEPGDYRWLYFAPPQFEELPVTHQDQFLFLDNKSTNYVYKRVGSIDLLCGDDGWGNTPFAGGCYREVEKFEMGLDNDALKKWLYNRGISFSHQVVLLPTFKTESTPAILTTWKMVIKYTHEFFESDNLIIIPPNIEWCLHFHHDRRIHFAKGRNW